MVTCCACQSINHLSLSLLSTPDGMHPHSPPTPSSKLWNPGGTFQSFPFRFQWYYFWSSGEILDPSLSGTRVIIIFSLHFFFVNTSILIRRQLSIEDHWGFFFHRSRRSMSLSSPATVIIRMSMSRCEEVYGRCEELVTQSMIPHHPSRMMSSIGSASTLLNMSPCSNTTFSFEDPYLRSSFYRDMSQSLIMSGISSFLFYLPYYMRQERSCFASPSTYWCLASIPVIEFISLILFLALYTIHRTPADSFSVPLAGTAILAIMSTFMTINRESTSIPCLTKRVTLLLQAACKSGNFQRRLWLVRPWSMTLSRRMSIWSRAWQLLSSLPPSSSRVTIALG